MRRLFPLLVCMAFVAGPAAAQDITAMHMNARNSAGSEPLGDPVKTHAFAICIADDYDGTGILNRLPNTEEETDFVFYSSRFRGQECRPGNWTLTVAARFLRGGAAEYLLERRRARTIPEVFDMPNNEELQRLSPDTRSAVVFIQIGECAARANSAGVLALLKTDIGSREEAAAFEGVVPAVGDCVPDGINFGIPPLLLRAYLAEGAYRNMIADRAANSGEAAQ